MLPQANPGSLGDHSYMAQLNEPGEEFLVPVKLKGGSQRRRERLSGLAHLLVHSLT